MRLNLTPLFGTKIMHSREIVRIETCVPEPRLDPDAVCLFIDRANIYDLAIAAIMERDIYQMSRAAMRATDFLGPNYSKGQS